MPTTTNKKYSIIPVNIHLNAEDGDSVSERATTSHLRGEVIDKRALNRIFNQSVPCNTEI